MLLCYTRLVAIFQLFLFQLFLVSSTLLFLVFQLELFVLIQVNFPVVFVPVVGVLEHLPETLTVLEHKVPQFFRGVKEAHRRVEARTEHSVNQNSVKSSHVSDEVKDVLRQRLSSEYELYQHIKQKLFIQYNSTF